MYTHAENLPESTSRVVNDSQSGQFKTNESSFTFADNRQESVMQGKLNRMFNNSQQTQRALQLRDVLNNNSQYPIQKEERLEEEELMQPKEIQRAGKLEEEKLLQSKAIQRQPEPEEEELLQGKFNTIPKVEEEEALHERAMPIQKRENNTGLPDTLKAGIENLSGYSMENVKVHYNSAKPAIIQAHAYAQGTDIHLASGQEKHLPHEAWHVVQQKQGRVKPTMQMKGNIQVNDDKELEKEADVMGSKALNITMPIVQRKQASHHVSSSTIQSQDIDIIKDDVFYTPEILMQRVRIAGVRYKTVGVIPGSNYRLVRLPNTTQRLINNMGAGTVLAGGLSVADADQLIRVMRNFSTSGVININALVNHVSGAVNGGAAMAITLAGIMVTGNLGCVHANVIPHTRFSVYHALGSANYYMYDPRGRKLLGTTMNLAEAGQLTTVFADLHTQGVSGLDSLVKSVDKARELTIPINVTLERMRMIHDNIRDVIRVRIAADHATICGMPGGGALDPVFANAFVSIEIPGSDPHKHGQVVAFINYRTMAGGTHRVVYKPGDLSMDQVLFNDQNSVASTLGHGVESYRIENMPADALAGAQPHLAHYGYMEFVQTGAPRTAAQLRSVFKSLGANLAVAYVFGLRDVHGENFVLKNDSIQLIDMEASTNTFDDFGAMELTTAAKQLPDELYKRIAKGMRDLTAVQVAGLVPDQATLIQQVRVGFKNRLRSMSPNRHRDAALTGLINQSTNTETRFVPIPTEILQQLSGLFYGQLAVVGGPSEALFQAATNDRANQVAHTSGNPPGLADEFRTMLRANGARTALHRGDVPFWTRQGNDIYGEDGALEVSPSVHPRLNTSGQNEIDANNRRASGNRHTAYDELDNDLIPLLGDPTAAIIAAHAAL
ncbi:DUF4135 domain-containing protein [Saccharicrinis sp. GN24d3]|uniref:DUF4135 domain-containing protein n=1 Tax=Saccharicrinis sp. GN24d3 TaxID=3458416 RepID=UPI0040375DD2